MLEEKHYECSRVNEDSAKKADHNLDMRDKLVELEKETDLLKA